MLLNPSGTVRSSSDAHRLSPLNRLLFIGGTLVTDIAAAHLTPPADATAPEEIAPYQREIDFGRARDQVPAFAESWVSPAGHTASAHSSAICALPSGDLLAVWYGGAREGGGDVALFTSRLRAGSGEWTTPVTAMDRTMAEDELDRMIKKVGNAVIFPDQAGRLWMV